MPLVKPPQDYVAVDAALPSAVNFGPAERAQMVKKSIDICEKKGVRRRRLHPEDALDDGAANTEGLFAYYRYAEASFILTCRTPDGTGSGWAGHDRPEGRHADRRGGDHRDRRDKALKSQKPRAIEPGNYTVILEPRPAARFLSLMLDVAQCARRRRGPQLHERRGAGHDQGRPEGVRRQRHASAATSVTRCCGSRRSARTASPRSDVTWVEKGVVKNLYYDRFWAQKAGQGADADDPGLSLVMDGGTTTLDEMIKTTQARAARVVLLVHPRRSSR